MTVTAKQFTTDSAKKKNNAKEKGGEDQEQGKPFFQRCTHHFLKWILLFPWNTTNPAAVNPKNAVAPLES